MLLRFRVENYRSIRDRQELSFVATSFNDGSAVALPVVPEGHLNVSPVIGLYGANASGKSNVLRALGRLRRLAAGGKDAGAEQPACRYERFLLDAESADRPLAFEVEFVVGGVRYDYGLAIGAEVVISEWLHAFPKGRRQVWFEREATRAEPFRFPGEYLKGAKATLTELVRPDVAFLALGASVRHAQLTPLSRFLSRIAPVDKAGLTPRGLGERLAQRWNDRLSELVRRADIGISGAEVVEVAYRPGDGPVRGRQLRLVHTGSAGSVTLPLQQESEGTLSWLAMLVPILKALETGGVVVVDELDGSLHPSLAAEVIRMFRDPGINTNYAQLLFSSHDVTMLGTQFGSPLLDRDQIWFTEKDDRGATDLYCLAELKPRKGENIERGYLSGRYGAVPDLSPGELGRLIRTALDEDAA